MKNKISANVFSDCKSEGEKIDRITDCLFQLSDEIEYIEALLSGNRGEI